jgi:ACS family glucarate transporter-like MFS transporter
MTGNPPAAGETSPTQVRYVVLGALCLAATFAYIQRNCIAVAEEDIRNELGLTLHEMGQVMSGFFLTYALFQLPTGWLGDWWGTRRALPVYASLWSAFTALMAAAVSYPALLLTRLGAGAAQAGIFPCSTNTVALWFPRTQRGLASAALGSFMSVGSVIASSLTGVLLVYLTWQSLFVLYALPGVLWAVAFWIWFRDRPERHPDVNPAEVAVIREGTAQPTGPREPTPWARLATSLKLWAICGQQFFRAAGYMFFTSWFATYLKETRGLKTIESGFLTSLPLLAVVVGTLTGGVVSDWVLARTGSLALARKWLSVGSMAVCALMIVVAYFLEDAVVAVLVISLGSFVASVAAPCAYAITIDMGGRHVATVFSTMNMAGNLGAFLFPMAVPELVVAAGGWEPVLFLFAGIYVGAALCWALVDTRGTVYD